MYCSPFSHGHVWPLGAGSAFLTPTYFHAQDAGDLLRAFSSSDSFREPAA